MSTNQYAAVPTVEGTTTPMPQHQQQPIAVPTGDWSSGLFSCFDDMSSFCEVFWCHYCQTGYQYDALTGGPGIQPGVPSMNIPIVCGTLLLDVFVFGGLANWIVNWHIRTETRRKFNITQGRELDEACKFLWCSPCSQCQVYRELSARGFWPGGILTCSPPQFAAAPAPVVVSMGAPEYSAQPQGAKTAAPQPDSE